MGEGKQNLDTFVDNVKHEFSTAINIANRDVELHNI